MLTTKYCACCGKRFYIECESDEWAYKHYSYKEGSSEYFCSWNCLQAFRGEYKEYMKRWKKVKKLARCLKENDCGFAWNVKNIYDFVIENPKILKQGGKYDENILKEIKNRELQRNKRKGNKLCE